MRAWNKAEELGAVCRSGINWTWADGFTRDKAEEFIRWLEANGYEHRGIYPEQGCNLCRVRFR